ncbi:MAG: DUF21 domain-containing protein [Phycisphaerales bacterium]|nr:DUF21 domain-containing protein [Phycisphaerales bacterium]
MEPGRLALLLLLPPLIAASAFCSASETALFSLTQTERARMRRASPGAAAAVAALLARPRGLLITILLLNNLVNVVYFVLSTVFAGGHEGSGGGLVAVLIGAASVFGLVLFGEILPKLLASRLRYQACRLIARPLLVLDRALSPVRNFVDRRLVAPLARLARPTGRHPPRVSADELSRLLALSASEGALGHEDQHLLQDVVDLSTLRVRQIMTHRVDMDWLDAGAADAEVLDLVRRSDGAPILVCRGSPDGEILGWLDAKTHLSRRQAAGHPTPLAESLQPVLYIPERARLDQLLDLLRTEHRSFGVCVDEYGTVVGITGVWDVTRRLVSDSVTGPLGGVGVEPAGEGRWIVPGRMNVLDLAEMLDPARSRRELDRTVSTVAGLFLLRLGRVPRAGDVIRLGNVEMRVGTMEGRAVGRVVVTLTGEAM